MKKFITLYLLFALCSFYAAGQALPGNIELSSLLTVMQDSAITARNQIWLKPGFQFAAQTRKSLHLQIAAGGLRIKHIDKNDGKMLSGGKFRITKANNVLAGNYIVSNGQAILSNLDWGTYYITETAPPVGYDSIKAPRAINVNANTIFETVYEYVKSDLTGCITVYQNDNATDAPLTGGEISIKTADNQVIGNYIVENGQQSIPNLQYGIYTITEVTPPAGYQSITVPYTVTVNSNDNCASVNYSYVYSITTPPDLPRTVSLRYQNIDPYNNYAYWDTIIAPRNVNYTGVRIGEYYWMNNNFNHRPPVRYVSNDPNNADNSGGKNWFGSNLIGEESQNSQYGVTVMTQPILDKYMDRIFIDPNQYQVNLDTFNYYYGIHYGVASMIYLNYYGQMYENNSLNTSWGYPSANDAKQLLAMSDVRNPDGILREQHVRFDLSPLPNENPLAFDMSNPNNSSYQTYWFSDLNTNRYNYNMMPGGARLNGDGVWSNGLGPIQPGGGWYGNRGDIYHLFYTSKMTTAERDAQGAVTGYGILNIHDWLTFEGKSYHWDNARWCRKLTDEELGYKLYMNADSTDIQKLALNQTPQTGYTELPNGYLRGFYVQYILDNPTPSKTVADIVYMAKVTECFNSKRVSDRPANICAACGVCPPDPQTRRGKLPEDTEKRLEDVSNSGVKTLSVYPNPVVDVLYIDSESPIVSVKVYSSTGSLAKRTGEVERSIDTGSLVPGIYTFVIQTEKENATFRIVKK